MLTTRVEQVDAIGSASLDLRVVFVVGVVRVVAEIVAIKSTQYFANLLIAQCLLAISEMMTTIRHE